MIPSIWPALCGSSCGGSLLPEAPRFGDTTRTRSLRCDRCGDVFTIDAATDELLARRSR